MVQGGSNGKLFHQGGRITHSMNPDPEEDQRYTEYVERKFHVTGRLNRTVMSKEYIS